jgi:actin-related protein 8
LEGRRKLIDRSYDLYDGSPNDPLSNAMLDLYQEVAATLPSDPNLTSDSKPPETNSSTPARTQSYNLLSRLNNNNIENTPRSSVAGSPAPEGTPQPAADASSAVDAAENAEMGKIFTDPTVEKIKAAEMRDKILPAMPLDAAILLAITHGAKGDERKIRDFLGGIMLIGGGGKIIGLGQFLEERLRLLRPHFTKEILIGPPPRDLDPQVVCWKGGSVFGKLSSNGNDSWITQYEYDIHGARLLNSKVMFVW